MSNLRDAIFSPFGLFLICILAGAILENRKRILLTLAFSNVIFFSLPVVSISLISSLENRTPKFEIDNIPPSHTGILLGGGVNVIDEKISRAELGSSGDRLALATELYKKNKIIHILIVGNSSSNKGTKSEARQSAEILQSWGVPSDAISMEERSLNTLENAVLSMKHLKEPTDHPSILITSAMHMPRARALYCRQGIRVTGFSANHWVREYSSLLKLANWIPNSSSLNGSTRALNEYAAIVYYAIVGKISLHDINHDHSCTRSQA